MPKNKKAESSFGIILIIGIFIIGGYFLYYQPSQISNNKDKANECYNNLENIQCLEGQACMPNPAAYFCECMGGKSSLDSKCAFGIFINYDEWSYFCMMNPTSTKYNNCISMP